MIITLWSEASLLAFREAVDRGRLAVQVEDKIVKIRNVKVRLLMCNDDVCHKVAFNMQSILVLLLIPGEFGVVCRFYLSQKDVYSLGSTFFCLCHCCIFLVKKLLF